MELVTSLPGRRRGTARRSDSTRRPAPRATIAILFAVAMALPGCAAPIQEIALRPMEDLRIAPPGRFVPPEGTPAESDLIFGVLDVDSLVLYEPSPAREPSAASGTPMYGRAVRRFGWPGLSIAGYTTAEGQRVRFKGTVRREGDSLAFEPPRHRGMGTRPPVAVRLATADVRSLEGRFPGSGRLVLSIAAFSIVAGVLLRLAPIGAWR